jgi:hypothetical protein
MNLTRIIAATILICLTLTYFDNIYVTEDVEIGIYGDVIDLSEYSCLSGDVQFNNYEDYKKHTFLSYYFGYYFDFFKPVEIQINRFTELGNEKRIILTAMKNKEVYHGDIPIGLYCNNIDKKISETKIIPVAIKVKKDFCDSGFISGSYDRYTVSKEYKEKIIAKLHNKEILFPDYLVLTEVIPDINDDFIIIVKGRTGHSSYDLYEDVYYTNDNGYSDYIGKPFDVSVQCKVTLIKKK